MQPFSPLKRIYLPKEILFLIATTLPILGFSQFPSILKKNNASIAAVITQYDTSRFNQVSIRKKVLLNKNNIPLNINGADWKITHKISPVINQTGVYHIQLTFSCTAGSLTAASVSLDIDFNNWSSNNYVLMPGAVYNGNRVRSIKQPYLSFWADSRDIGIDKPQLVSDIPRLNINNGVSRIQQRSGDMSTPSIGFYSPASKSGYWLLTNQSSSKGDHGIDIEENSSRTNANIRITAPVVREQFAYTIADMTAPSYDKPANFIKGDSIQLTARIYFFDCNSIQGLYNYFAGIKNDLLPEKIAPASVPFSVAFSMLEEKFNRQNFEPNFGYYSVGLRENCYQDWQIGWTGGMISTYPLLLNGGEQSRKNVIRNFDWLFADGISPSGYFWDTGEKGNKWFGIFPSSSVAKDLHLIRKSGDGLFYILKQFEAFRKLGINIKPAWEIGVKKVGDAMLKTWRQYHQLGQYVNNTTGELIIGGSTSGGIVPAALLLLSDYFKEPKYAVAAKEIAKDYAEKYISKGLIYGGAGDAMQNFDSESCYGLLASFIELYEYTKDPYWLKVTEDIALQFSTWISSYDFNFPIGSTLAKLGKKTTGVVWANTQNKHGAPGICTHSGIALLKLYRATGKYYYLHLLELITKAIPQYIATDASPIPGLQPAWISERVSTTDWLEGIGEIFPGSTWSETAMMLTATELPSIYLDIENRKLACFDQLSAKIIGQSSQNIELEIFNPTKYICTASVYADQQTNVNANTFNYTHIKVDLNPAERKTISIPIQPKK